MESQYSHLFEPLKVNNMMLRNRIISAPCKGLHDKALAGIAVITRGGRGNVPDGRCRWRVGPYCFETVAKAEKEREFVTEVHQRGAKAELQIVHSGQFAVPDKKGDYVVGPMSYTREDGVEVKGLTREMMEELCQAYGRVATDAKEYGYDMIMLHFAHGWLGTQFLSPHYNKRTDEFGGCLENRIKFPTMIIDAVRKAVGKDFPINMRVSVDEKLPDGSTVEDIAYFIKSVQDRIDMVQLTVGIHKMPNGMISSTYIPHMYNRKNARLVKSMVNIPVAVVGAILTPEEAEDIIASGDADAVVMARAMIADPLWAQKARENRAEDIVPCLRCLNCQTKELDAYGSKNINCCSVNPRHGHEDTVPLTLDKAESIKHIYIIGGGPAGMKAALVLSQRGHRVTLLEKENKLGGQLCCADYDPAKQDLKRYLDYLRYQIGKSNVDVRLNCDANDYREDIKKADALIIAVGADSITPRIDGIDGDNVMSAIDAYRRQEEIGQKVAIIGGGSIGMELAKMLALQGKKVTVIEATDKLAFSLNDTARAGLLDLIKKIDNIEILTNSMCKSIQEDGCTILHEGNLNKIDAETVIVAVGMKSKTDLANSFYGLTEDTNMIGDCLKVGTVSEATRDAFYASWKL